MMMVMMKPENFYWMSVTRDTCEKRTSLYLVEAFLLLDKVV